jgi:general secretion pathway protein K
VALIAVLWLVALLTLLATTVVTLSVTQRRTADRYGEAVRTDLTLDAAIRVVLLRLIAPSERGASAEASGRPFGVGIFEDNVSVTVQRELSRLDLNAADPDLLIALFAANGWRESDARSMTARIVDWRDLNEHESAHLADGAANRPFQSVEELKQLPGGDRIRGELLDSFTVFTHVPGCVQSVATPALQRALAWADERQLGGHRWLSNEPKSNRPDIASTASITLGGEVLRLVACSDGRSADRCRVAVVRLTGSLSRPFQIFEWRSESVASNANMTPRS